MQHTLTLSDAERRLLLELLQEERGELPTEIHHTDDRGVREELRERQQMVEQLMDRIQQVPVR